MRILTGTNALVENRNISQLLDYYQLNHYLCEYLELLKKQIDTGQSVIFTEMIKYEMVFMLMKMFQSSKVKDVKSTYKENITSAITHYQLVGYIQQIEEAL